MNIIDVTRKNVDEVGFFCLMSRRKTEGWQRKRKWLEARFAEGLRIKMLDLSEGGRGFIEYIPGEFAWRPVHARGWLFIHCLWVVGKSKGNGFAGHLLEECLADARERGAKGVAMVTSEGNWLVGRKILARHGFELVDQADPGYELLARSFEEAESPSFPTNWKQRAAGFGKGMTIIRSDQCPYLDDAVHNALDTAQNHGLEARVVELANAREVRELSPSPYGVFTIVFNGTVLSHYYQPTKKLEEILSRRITG